MTRVPWIPAIGIERNEASSAPAVDAAVATASSSPDARWGGRDPPSQRTATEKQAPIRMGGGSSATAEAPRGTRLNEPSEATRAWKTRPQNQGRGPRRW